MRQFTQNKDVDRKIFSFLNYQDLLNISLTCKYTYSLLDKVFWRNKIDKDFPKRSKFHYQKYIELRKGNPKKLYNIINAPSKIIDLKKEHCYKFPQLTEIRQEDFNEITSESLINLIIQNVDLSQFPLRRGDILRLDWIPKYRNNGKLIWTGEKLITLDTSLDNYGNLPREFSFPEFSLNHFHKTIDHNNIIWLSLSNIDELIKNYIRENFSSRISDGYQWINIHIYRPYLDENNLIKFIKEHPYVEYNYKYDPLNITDKPVYQYELAPLVP
jgi:hypothetical protein